MSSPLQAGRVATFWGSAEVTAPMPLQATSPRSEPRKLRAWTPRDMVLYVSFGATSCLLAGVFCVHLLSLFGATHAWAAWVALGGLFGLSSAQAVVGWMRWLSMRRPEYVPPPQGLKVAMATTFVPETESLAVLEQTLRAMVAVTYPHDSYVLDEGDDPRVRELCDSLGARFYSRKARIDAASGQRTKAGNLNAWVEDIGRERYEFITFLDSDHAPIPQYLHRVLGYFSFSKVGYVQAPQTYRNQAMSLVARGAAEHTYAYYGPYQRGLYGLGLTIIDGSHTTYRTRDWLLVGGMPEHLVEDLAMSYVMERAGVKGVYAPEVIAAGLAPEDWGACLTQQYRWAAGGVDVRLRFQRSERSALGRVARLFLFLHSLVYFRVLEVPLQRVLLASLLVIGRFPKLSVALVASGLSLALLHWLANLWMQRFFISPERERGILWRSVVVHHALWPTLVRATFDALRGRIAPRQVTPKSGRASTPLIAFLPHGVCALVILIALLVSIARGDHDAWLFRAFAVISAIVDGAVIAAALLSLSRDAQAQGSTIESQSKQAAVAARPADPSPQERQATRAERGRNFG